MKDILLRAGGRIKAVLTLCMKGILVRIDPIVGLIGLIFIWSGLCGYDRRIALITVGSILFADFWLDKIVKYIHRLNR